MSDNVLIALLTIAAAFVGGTTLFALKQPTLYRKVITNLLAKMLEQGYITPQELEEAGFAKGDNALIIMSGGEQAALQDRLDEVVADVLPEAVGLGVTAIIGVFLTRLRPSDRSGMQAINRAFFTSAGISAVLSAVAVTACLAAGSATQRALSLAPLAWIGRISYSLADIDAATGAARLGLRLDSGALFRLGALRVTGMERYDPVLVPRLARLPVGMVYDQEKIVQAQLRLAGSGYFDSAFIFVDPEADPLAAVGLQVASRVLEVEHAPVARAVAAADGANQARRDYGGASHGHNRSCGRSCSSSSPTSSGSAGSG